jgi:hypothetical protein
MGYDATLSKAVSFPVGTDQSWFSQALSGDDVDHDDDGGAGIQLLDIKCTECTAIETSS